MDREKVIKGLEFTKSMITFNPSTGEDIEPENLNEADKTSYDACVGAIALLKEQEAKQVTIVQAHFGMKYGLCPRCEKQIDTLVNPSFCGNCGQAVKWE
jgi:hypothetical protein